MEKIIAVTIGLLMFIRGGTCSSGGSAFPGGSKRTYYYINFGKLAVDDKRDLAKPVTEEQWAWIEAICVWSYSMKWDVFNAEAFDNIREDLCLEIANRECGGIRCLERIGTDHYSLCPNPAHIPRVMFALGQEYGTKTAEYGSFLRAAAEFVRMYPSSDEMGESGFISAQLAEVSAKQAQRAAATASAQPALSRPAVPMLTITPTTAAALEVPAASVAAENAKRPNTPADRQDRETYDRRRAPVFAEMLLTTARRTVWVLGIALLAVVLMFKSPFKGLPS